MVAMVGSNTAAILKGSWGTFEPFLAMGPLQASSHSHEALGQCHSPGNLQLFCGWWWFWLDALHLQLIFLLSLNHPFPRNVTMGSSFRASWDGRNLTSSNYWPGGVYHLLPPRELIWGLLLFSQFFSNLCNSLFNRGVGLHWLGTLGGSFLWLGDWRFLWDSHATEDVLIRKEM